MGIREVRIDRGACMGSRVCMARAPRSFALDEAGKARVLGVDRDSGEALRRAAADCPRFAIAILENDGESRWTGRLQR